MPARDVQMKHFQLSLFFWAPQFFIGSGTKHLSLSTGSAFSHSCTERPPCGISALNSLIPAPNGILSLLGQIKPFMFVYEPCVLVHYYFYALQFRGRIVTYVHSWIPFGPCLTLWYPITRVTIPFSTDKYFFQYKTLWNIWLRDLVSCDKVCYSPMTSGWMVP